MHDNTDTHARAVAYLLRAAEPPAPAVRSLVAELGALRAAERVRSGDVSGAVRAETEPRRHLDLAEVDLAEAAAAGARLVTPAHDEWPTGPLSALASAAGRGHDWAAPPLGLWVRGTHPLANLLAEAVAVVGARAATGYGEHVSAEFGYGLTERGFTVISGAAYGVDAAAHRGALAADGPTVAMLACGVDVAYPSGHTDLLRRIGEHGAIVSEYPPGTPPGRHRFLARNRLVATLAGGTVVVEASRRSGARTTAATAHALGRMVMAVPGPVSSTMSVGCHDLLRCRQARLVTTAADVAESLHPA